MYSVSIAWRISPYSITGVDLELVTGSGPNITK